MYKPYIENKKAVIFDLDGTLVETQQYWEYAYEDVLEKLELEYVDASKYLLPGATTKDDWKIILDQEHLKLDVSIDDLVKYTQIALLNEIKNVELDLREGFWALADELKMEKNLKLGLATNSTSDITSRVLTKLDIADVFDAIICSDEIKRPKPNPEIYREIAKKLGVQPKEMLVFEDSIIGVQSALAAGTSVIVIWNGEVPREFYPQQTLNFYSDFSPLAGNLDKTPEETVIDFASRFVRKK